MGKGGGAAARILMSRIKNLKAKYCQSPQSIIAESLTNMTCKLQPAESEIGNVRIILNPTDFHKVKAKEELYSLIAKEIEALDNNKNYETMVEVASKAVILSTTAELGTKAVDLLFQVHDEGPVTVGSKLFDKMCGIDKEQLETNKKLLADLAHEVHGAANRIHNKQQLDK